MGATWIIILLWFAEKWEQATWQDATGIQVPIWLGGTFPPYDISDEDLSALSDVARSVSGAESISKARKAWSNGSKRGKIAVKNYVIHVMSLPTWRVSQVVERVFAEGNCTPKDWLRLTQSRVVCDSPKQAGESELMIVLCHS